MTQPTLRRNGRALYLVATALGACAGERFTVAPDDAAAPSPPVASSADPEGPGASRPIPTSAPSSSSLPHDEVDAATSPPAFTGPCGTLRGEDAPEHSAEVCQLGGRFEMGSNEPNLGGTFADHRPAHTMHVTPFVMDRYEVTVARYRRCVVAGSCTMPVAGGGCTYWAGDEARPITCISWYEAEQFCRWDEGRRLPSEAEWEYAARGPAARLYPWEGSFSCRHAVLGGGGACPEHATLLPLAVGSSPLGQTPDGVLDLAGNAAEWVGDWFGRYPKHLDGEHAPPPNGSMRVIRGGGWLNRVQAGLGYTRMTASPSSHGNWGFRCSREANRQ